MTDWRTAGFASQQQWESYLAEQSAATQRWFRWRLAAGIQLSDLIKREAFRQGEMTL